MFHSTHIGWTHSFNGTIFRQSTLPLCLYSMPSLLVHRVVLKNSVRKTTFHGNGGKKEEKKMLVKFKCGMTFNN